MSTNLSATTLFTDVRKRKINVFISKSQINGHIYHVTTHETVSTASNTLQKMAGVFVLLGFVLLVFVVGACVVFVCYWRSKTEQRKEMQKEYEYNTSYGSQFGTYPGGATYPGGGMYPGGYPGAYSTYGPAGQSRY
ncbi:unnamed protein product [Anisakis simplex]|uniref:Protein lifeguard 1-like n=1 Tax=Anisakis simplex TaxID=6269 RepID=A0A0M3KBP0_ANISI|nr:unnamed protein product [Anisakis simplex]